MEQIDNDNLGRRVYKLLKTMIVDGELRSGDKLVQERLAARLGVSRTPLLAAFSHLEQERLVESHPRRGSYVRRYSREELLNIYDLRCRLEPLGARGAALHAGADGVAVLERLFARFQAAVASGDPYELKRADYELHMEVARRSGNDFLYEMLATFNIIVIANTKGLLKPAEQSAREHAELFEAVRAGDADRSERAMFEHLCGAREALLRGDVFVEPVPPERDGCR